MCSSFHPKCEGATFDGKTCKLRANVKKDQASSQSDTDAGIAIFPTASSNCPTLGGSQTNNNGKFDTFCNVIVNGKDIIQNFAPTFQDCMGQCAGTTGCNAVSFDASMAGGFKNCYMKTGVVASDNVANTNSDTGILRQEASNDGPAPVPVPVQTAAPVSPNSVPDRCTPDPLTRV